MDNLGFFLALLSVRLLLCALVARTAASYHRTPSTWFLLALLTSPLLLIVVLVILGDPEETSALEEKVEQLRQKHPDRKDLVEAALNEMPCPHCGATVNPITEDGLHSPEAAPWLLICNRCQGEIDPDV